MQYTLVHLHNLKCERGQFLKENQDISPVELGEEVVQTKPRDAYQGS